jgi:hypothetical protein
VLLLNTIPASALAQWAEEMEQAVTAFNGGDFQRSLKLLKRVAPSVRDPKELGRVHLYVGLNHAFLGQQARAKTAFAAALTHNPELEVDPKRIRPDVVQLFISVHGTLKGALEVSSGPQGASVRVDGAEQGEPPVRLDLVVGRHHVEVRDAGGRSLFRDWVVIRRGKITPVKIQAAAPGPVTEYKPPTRDPVNTSPLPRPEQPVDQPTGKRSRLWGWVALGGAVVSTGVAIGLLFSGRSDFEEYDTMKVETDEDKARLAELKDSIVHKHYASWAMFGLGAALAVAAGVLLYLDYLHEADTSKHVRLRIDGSGVGFTF